MGKPKIPPPRYEDPKTGMLCKTPPLVCLGSSLCSFFSLSSHHLFIFYYLFFLNYFLHIYTVPSVGGTRVLKQNCCRNRLTELFFCYFVKIGSHRRNFVSVLWNRHCFPSLKSSDGPLSEWKSMGEIPLFVIVVMLSMWERWSPLSEKWSFY